MGDEGVRAVGVRGAGHSRNCSYPGAGDLAGEGEEAGVRLGDVRSREPAAMVGTGGVA